MITENIIGVVVYPPFFSSFLPLFHKERYVPHAFLKTLFA